MVGNGGRAGILTMKIYVLMLLISMILMFSYWTKSDEASLTESA